MFGISFEELIVLLVLALILFGPEKLPEYADKLGRMVAKLRQASSDLSESMHSSPSPSRRRYPEPPKTTANGGFSEAEALTASSAATEPHMTTVNEGFCPQCGQILGYDFTFCPKCGHRLKGEPKDVKPLTSSS